MNMEVELVAPLSVGTTADGEIRLTSVEFLVPIWKLVNSREFSKFDSHQFFILKPYIFEELSVLLVDTGASVLVFPVSSPPPNSECQCSTENYQRLWQIALQFGSGLFVWTFLLADGSMAILSTEFLCHHHLLVGVEGFLHFGCFLPGTDFPCFLCFCQFSFRTFYCTVGNLGRIIDLLAEYADVITSKGYSATVPKHPVRHSVSTDPGPLVFAKASGLDAEKLESARKEFTAMEAAGVIINSNSPWASPIHMLQKPDCSWHPCGDNCH